MCTLLSIVCMLALGGELFGRGGGAYAFPATTCIAVLPQTTVAPLRLSTFSWFFGAVSCLGRMHGCQAYARFGPADQQGSSPLFLS
ncbi:hypothetical protein F5883DRAFT_539207 [Diaporthe sp. PMI_573]|nr:hypothetical protein F5883DRAFT_539207 [Diaporthaceae sp. PMI_573]